MVAVVIWLAVNVILPIALLNSALALTVAGLVKKEHKTTFAVFALVGGGYMLLDILNGWLSVNFVNNVVKDKSWISAFAYINSAAIGVSTWVLVEPLWTRAKLLGISETQKRIALMGSSVLLVAIATASIPIVYNTVQNSFAQHHSWTNSNTNNNVAPHQEPVGSSGSVASNSIAHAMSADTVRDAAPPITEFGTPEFRQPHTSFTGLFRDQKSGEMLSFSDDGQVSYRAKEGGRLQTLIVPRRDEQARTATVQFGGSPKNYQLSLSADVASLNCENPDGTVQTFVRVDAAQDAVTAALGGDLRNGAGRWGFTSVRKVVHADVGGLSTGELRLMRNEIFARHGRPFDSSDLKSHFSQQPWYHADQQFQESSLSAIEKTNVALISGFEAAQAPEPTATAGGVLPQAPAVSPAREAPPAAKTPRRSLQDLAPEDPKAKVMELNEDGK